ncbi:hypothetical protein EDEG_02557 [Edhazardia aedis USNM 41457]|uniref:phosphomevalonate kinase n=1 Tax=Edhazardia aedis (strain USNM 41457) TaxID=1003232 RepID=J8ZTW0_EDHAE|nr:hypothetical protein EDEG_02557 [Edhazardia aedis USNM 41457]|eukprot:EJW03078.1 hypothetical protein EDEG_02557 [Edhazardia aedis USNM 41457]
MKDEYVIEIPGKVVINGGYLVLNEPNECVCIVPNIKSRIKVSKKISEKTIISIKTNFLDSCVFEYNNSRFIISNFTDIESSMIYCLNLANAFLDVTGIVPANQHIELFINLEDILFSTKKATIKDSIKTGLGSSCVFLIAIVDALLEISMEEREFFDLCIQVNSKISPKSSGCDIGSTLLGNIIYKKHEYTKIRCLNSDYAMILCSFNSSTNTRTMLDFVDLSDHKWKNLNIINNEIIHIFRSSQHLEPEACIRLKKLYKDYLVTLRNISTQIVPEKQYELLLKTFKMPVVGCGVSGSGGEDCVWVIVSKANLIDVYSFLNNNFSYTRVVTDLSGESNLSKLKKLL